MDLEERLGYRFLDPSLLAASLTHRSFAHETGAGIDNQRLEFLGDAVVDLLVSGILMERLPDADEGALTEARARIVSEAGLCRAAELLGLGGELRLGRGEEQTGGRGKASILADALEAVIGAVYLDGGIDAAAAVVGRVLGPVVAEALESGAVDSKTRLQRWAQARLGETPRYIVVAEEGPGHAKSFEVAVVLGGSEAARGRGRSKKEAEQRAAQDALTALTAEGG
ncbi:MAG: ribonuclease III [Myxococcota bacterium]